MEDQDTLIDTHAHLASSRFETEREDVVRRAKENGVTKLISIACDIEDAETNLRLAAEYPEVAATAGIHPLYVHERDDDSWMVRLTEMARSEPIAAIGEIGLDYFHPPQDGSTEAEWRSLQRDIFEQQLQLATDLDLPVVIHQRESAADVTEVLRGFPKVSAVLHCFSGTLEEAMTALEMGHLLSFTGILTFPSAKELREVVAEVPLDRVMLETDSPFLAPVPFRGKRCEPFMVRHTATALAALHGRSDREIAKITTQNAHRFFRNLSQNASS